MDNIKGGIGKSSLVGLLQEMKLLHLSPNIVKSYAHYINQCLERSNCSARDVGAVDIRRYLENMADIGVSASTLNTAYSALRFYFERILRRKFFVSIPRARKRVRLPEPLSVPEVARLLVVLTNPKHRCI